ncbi:MAG: hypothetical protein OEZ39_02505 [Gammaproteobacteria bacterium]|nr:hypothetical protein [Gammaproteobacteria bacterium]MDH5650726.1 hypothetical protein [Gammaproteobacteria bacterium]
MADTTVIHCPVCLHARTVAADTSPYKTFRCAACQRTFTYHKALTADGKAVQHVLVDDRRRAVIRRIWLVAAIIISLTLYLLRPVVQMMDGPTFNLTYLFMFLGIWLLVVIYRSKLRTNQVTYAGLIGYELIGVLGWTDVATLTLPDSIFLAILMLFGGLLLFVRNKRSSDGSGSGGCGAGCGGGSGGGRGSGSNSETGGDSAGCGSGCGGGGCGS